VVSFWLATASFFCSNFTPFFGGGGGVFFLVFLLSARGLGVAIFSSLLSSSYGIDCIIIYTPTLPHLTSPVH
jgi:hypothetical protein